MDKLKEKLWKELDEIADKSDLSAGDLQTAHVLTDTIKNIDKICMLEDDGGYSHDDGKEYGRGSSYARGRSGRNVRRNSRGRYSRDDGRGEMMEHLEAAWDAAPEHDRENIKRFMRQLENA